MSTPSTLAWRFAALYASVLAILVGVCAVVLVHLERMRVDSERLMEESREHAITTRTLLDIGDLRSAIQERGVAAVANPAALDGVLAELRALGGPDDDPSREEHQSAEDRIVDRLRADLLRAGELLDVGSAADETELLERLDRAAHFAGVLRAETREESREAGEDVERRIAATRVVMVGVLLSALVLLGLALALVHRAIVRPIRRLRDGAERFGSGDLEHRIRVESDDEVGDLARSFNAMADRVGASQKDLEERVRQRTQEFLRAARLADLGVLASGIAHEINTPLASIASCAEGIERRLRHDGLSRELLEDYASTVARETYRAREITTRMLGLVRQEPGTVSSVSLALVLEQAVSALRHRAERHGVVVACAPTSPDVSVEANPGELVQILVNLLANAIDASARGDRVTLSAEVEDERLVLEVADEGEGIEPAAFERIFDPFYTTKRPGEGTGLGLPLVNALVESHAGRVSVTSEPGKGSTFRVTLPRRWEAEA